MSAAREEALFARLGPRARSAVVGALALGATGWFLVRANASYPVRDWLAWPMLKLWAYVALHAAACLAAGLGLLDAVFRVRDRPLLERAVLAQGVGLVAFVLAMYAGGFAGAFRPWFAFALPAVMLALGAPSLGAFALAARAEMRARRAFPREPAGLATKAAWAFGGLGVAMVYLGALTPESVNFDALWVHLTTADDWARAGRIIPHRADYARSHPQLATVVHTWAMLVPQADRALGWMLALHLEFAFFGWTLAGIAALARHVLGDARARGTRATWAAFFLFPAIFVYDHNLGGAADHYLAFFAVPVVLSAYRWAASRARADAALYATFAGGAVLTKYQANYLLVPSAALVIFAFGREIARRARARDRAMPVLGQAVASGLIALGVFALVVLPHFAKNAYWHKNPFYPFAQTWFKASSQHAHGPALVEYLFKDWDHRPHGDFLTRAKESLELSFTYSFEPQYSFTQNWPVLGSLFTLLWPAYVFARKNRALLATALIAQAGLLVWAATYRIDRNLQALTPVFAACVAAGLARAWELGLAARAGVLALVAAQVIWSGDVFTYTSKDRLVSTFDLVRSGYEGRAATRFKVFRKDARAVSERLPPGAVVVLHSMRESLGIEREVLLDWPGQQDLILYEDLAGPRALHDFYASIGATHLLRRAWRDMSQSLKAEILVQDVLRRAPALEPFGVLELAQLPADRPPPDDRKALVATVGMRGYGDGFYVLDDLHTYERLPEKVLKYAKRRAPFDRGSLETAAKLSSAIAIAIGPGVDASGPWGRIVLRDFEQVSVHPNWCVLFLKRNRPPRVPARR